jgi:hypothetical protein
MLRITPLALLPLILVTGCSLSGSVSHSLDHSRLRGSDVEVCECGRVHHTKRPLLKRQRTVLPIATRPLFPGDRWGQSADLSAPVSPRTAQVLPTQFPVQRVSWSGTAWSNADGCGECGEIVSGCHMPTCSQPVWIESGCHQPATCSQPVMSDACECTDTAPVTCSQPATCSQPVTCHAPVPIPAPAPPAPAPAPPALVPPAAAPLPPVQPGCNVPVEPQCVAPAAQPVPEVDFLPPVEEAPPVPPPAPAELGSVPMPNDMIDPISWEQIPTLPPLP